MNEYTWLAFDRKTFCSISIQHIYKLLDQYKTVRLHFFVVTLEITRGQCAPDESFERANRSRPSMNQFTILERAEVEGYLRISLRLLLNKLKVLKRSKIQHFVSFTDEM